MWFNHTCIFVKDWRKELNFTYSRYKVMYFFGINFAVKKSWGHRSSLPSFGDLGSTGLCKLEVFVLKVTIL